MSLPILHTDSKDFLLMQTEWSRQLNPILSNQGNTPVILKNISLKSNTVNSIDHLLQRKLQGWRVIRKRAQADIWDVQDNNPAPQTTLFLKSSGAVVIDLEVF